LLKQIEHQRNGDAVDSGLLKRVIDSYGPSRIGGATVGTSLTDDPQ
jgi:hypothetical protein